MENRGKHDKMGKHIKKHGKLQKLGNKHVMAPLIKSATGVASYTNYQMNSKHNPYLAPTNANIQGFNMSKSNNINVKLFT
jgi:hypothetical protein